jgi:glycosyltransferase involved in cell wall biosynthesis
MRVGIMGTRGIPNEYGGFEQFTMHFAEYLAAEGIDVVVYNSSNHPYQHKEWKGVEIVHCFDPEPAIGSSGQFVYDLFSVLDARKQQFDVLFQLGYTSSSVWGFLFPKNTKIITNMDGQEWKRSKYSSSVQKFLKKAEKWAVNQSDELIADSKAIQKYLKKTYNTTSHFIPYGADLIHNFDESILTRYKLTPKTYNLMIARLEPENNIESIIQGHILSSNTNLIIVGNEKTKYGKYLTQKYGLKVTFLGSNYNFEELNSIRYYSKLYFHGHSVGGTNPSLLEAMACGCSIIAHNNPFNKDVLDQNALYFSSAEDIQNILTSEQMYPDTFVSNNHEKIKAVYSFQAIHLALKKLIVNE